MSDIACKLLAVDIDGTLINGGRLHADDARALHRAAEAGLAICLCTGRSWAEARPVWGQLALPGPHAPVICVGGALVAQPADGSTLYARSFDRPTAAALAGAMRQKGYPVMALVDAWREGFDYCMVGRFDAHPLYRRFFDGRGWQVRYVDDLADPSLPCPLRISVLEEASACDELVEQWQGQFAGRIEIQAIRAPNYGLHIVESFAAGVNKFTALEFVGRTLGIAPSDMAAIGDDYNDLAMLAETGISATTADAPQELRQAATMTLGPRGQCPVAQFVHHLLNKN
jgi:hypothetical protein